MLFVTVGPQVNCRIGLGLAEPVIAQEGRDGCCAGDGESTCVGSRTALCNVKSEG